MLSLGHWFSEWGERLLAPVLIVIGLYFMLGHLIHRHEHCPNVHSRGHRFHGAGGSMALGLLLALSFCPESAVVYFGMLMPLSVESHGGFMLPVVFSVATAIPTVLMAWAVAYGLAGLSAMRSACMFFSAGSVSAWASCLSGQECSACSSDAFRLSVFPVSACLISFKAYVYMLKAHGLQHLRKLPFGVVLCVFYIFFCKASCLHFCIGALIHVGPVLVAP